MAGELDGKVALVTGAGSGIGAASAKALAAAGAKVGVLTHTPEEGQKVAQAIKAAGGEAMALDADVADAGSMEQAFAELAKAYGPISLVHANAGINGVWAAIDDLKPEEFDKTIATNLRGTFLALHFGAAHLKRAGGGAIVVTASVNGTRIFSNAGSIAYSTSKAGQVAMAKIAALELSPHKIRVNVVCPGLIETEIDDNSDRSRAPERPLVGPMPKAPVPLTGGPGGTSEEVADLVLFLLSDRARHISGTPVWIDGAESLLFG